MAKKIWLNEQEQIWKNKKDIEEIKSITLNLERFGVKVVGEETSAEDLPDPTTYGGSYGDAYLIGEEPPFDMYIFTQPSAGETDPKWFNIGPFPAPGEQGPEGPEGPEGPQGQSSKWRVGQVNPSILDTDKQNDLYLNTTTGMVYQFNGTAWIPYASIRGPEGQQGPQGLQGPTGQRGPTGPIGPVGPAGSVVEVIGVVDTLGSLPDPDDVPRNSAYVFDDGVNKDLYIIVEEDNELSWYNAGPFTGVAGDAAGFGQVTAQVTPLGPDDTPTANVVTSGPNTAKNMAFQFGLPVGIDLSNVAHPDAPSTAQGYTQKVIEDKTLNRVIRRLSDLGFSVEDLPVSVLDVIAAMAGEYPDTDLRISNESADHNINDAPTSTGWLSIRYGSESLRPDVRWLDNTTYDEYVFAGASGTTPIWHKVTTDADGGGGGYMPNLLINPDFRINQRGSASYAGTTAAYTVDRWRRGTSNNTVTVTPNANGTIGITTTSSSGSIYQTVEKTILGLAGKKITFSVAVGSDVINITGTVPSDNTLSNFATSDNVNGVTLILTNRSDGYIDAYIKLDAFNSYTIKWAKLEVGEAATPFSPPDTASELERCKWYYLYYAYTYIPPYQILKQDNTDSGQRYIRAYIAIPLNKMRLSNPTKGDLYMNGFGYYEDGTQWTNSGSFSPTIYYSGNGSLMQLTAMIQYFSYNKNFDKSVAAYMITFSLDAEIY